MVRNGALVEAHQVGVIPAPAIVLVSIQLAVGCS